VSLFAMLKRSVYVSVHWGLSVPIVVKNHHPNFPIP